MGHQPEYCQHHSHEQTEPAPSFGWQKAEQTTFHRFVCRNLVNPIRLISHVITTLVTKLFLNLKHNFGKKHSPVEQNPVDFQVEKSFSACQ